LQPTAIHIPGKYRTIVTKLSNLILDTLIEVPTISTEYNNILFVEVQNSSIPLHFYFGLQTRYGQTYVNGDAYNPTESTSKQIPYIEITIQTDNRKQDRSLIAMKLRNSIRHELEHLTQSGLNTLPGKYLPDDQEARLLASRKDYLLLKKEVPAMLKGLYFQATKERKPFDQMVDEYLNDTYLLKKEIEQIKSVWINKAKELNLWKNMT
jgi:hypothetical protein